MVAFFHGSHFDADHFVQALQVRIFNVKLVVPSQQILGFDRLNAPVFFPKIFQNERNIILLIFKEKLVKKICFF
jgi:hypothetical protein